MSGDLNALESARVWVDVTANELCDKLESLMDYAGTAPEAARATLERGLMETFALVKQPLEFGVARLELLGKEVGVPLPGLKEWVEAREAERAEPTPEETRANLEAWERDLETSAIASPLGLTRS